MRITHLKKGDMVEAISGRWRGARGKVVSILAKKGPEYSDIHSPYQLVEKLRAAGHQAEIKEFKAGTRPSVEVRAPSVGLYVMFVKKELCDKPAPPPEKK